MDYFSRVAGLIQEFYKNLTPQRRLALFTTLTLVVASVVMMLVWASKSAYQTLYTNLAAEDSTAIMRLLRDKKIPFIVENDGKTIKIPPEAVYDLRLELASSGYPQAGVIGYEVFDKQSFATTSFVQKLNQKRALEGELIRTINQLKGVKRSRVHLAMPPKTTFVEDEKNPTASVVVELEPGNVLQERQILGITNLVASAVEGMETGSVIILDGNGKILSKNLNDPVAKQTASLLELQQRLERDYEKRVEEIVSKVVGEGKVVAKVALDLDFTQLTETQTAYDQEGAAIKGQQKETHLMDGSRPVPTGPPGAASNTPNAPQGQQGPGLASTRVAEVRSNTQKSYETTNFAVPETVRRSVKPTYTIKRLNVAVLVDNEWIKKAEAAVATAAASDKNAAAPQEGDGPKKSMWDVEREKLQTVISSSVGFDKTRGDVVEIQGMEFRKDDLEDAENHIRAIEQRRLYRHLIEYAVLGLVILLFFLVVIRPFIKWLTDNTVDSMESFLPKTIEELEKLQSGDAAIATVEEVMPVMVDKVDPEKVEGQMIREKIMTLVEKNPGKAAMILHEWIGKPATSSASKDAEAEAV